MPVPSHCTSKEGESFDCFTGRCRTFTRWQLFPTISIISAPGHPRVGVSALRVYEPSTVGIHHTSPNLGLGMSAPFQLLLVASALALCSLQVLVNLCHVPFSSSFKVLSVSKYLQVFCIRRISLQTGGFSLTPLPPPDKKEANNITRTPRTRWDMDNIKHCTSQHGS